MSVTYEVEHRVDTGSDHPSFNASVHPWAMWLLLAIVTMIMVAYAVYGYMAPGT